MTREYASVLGSGTLPTLFENPSLQAGKPAGTYPIPSQRDQLKTRTGEGSILLNPEDLSVFQGIRPQAISVGASAVKLPTVPLEFRRALGIHNNGPGILYIGAIGVTTATGWPIAVNEKIAFDIQGNIDVYGISASTSDTRILELA